MFYGWPIALGSTLRLWATIPGQTMGMAVVTEYLIADLGLSRTQSSTAYLFGTVGSSLCLARAGRLYDQYGARTILVSSSVALGLCVVAITFIGPFSDWLDDLVDIPVGVFAFALITIGYFGVRLNGQGILACANRNILLIWFERRRGIVSGARGVFMSLGFSLAPLLIAALVDALGWHDALWTMAAITGLVFGLMALLFARDSPESCGLEPDGQVTAEHPHAAPPRSTTTPSYTLAQAQRTLTFWIYSLAIATYSLTGTAVTFHVVDIFEVAGRDRAQATGYFLPLACVAVCVNLVASWWPDKARLKPLLLLMLGGFVVGCFGLTELRTQWGFVVLVAGFGLGSGLWATLSSLAYVRFFGRKHLGEISGSAVALSVIGSAVGPALFSLGKDLSGGYTGIAWFCAVAFVALSCIAARTSDLEGPRVGNKG